LRLRLERSRRLVASDRFGSSVRSLRRQWLGFLSNIISVRDFGLLAV
jgi:hypothetical protein